MINMMLWRLLYSSFTFTAATEKNADVEDLVDDFATFFVAGMYIPAYSLKLL